jgi:uncharacterized repeat protein (TIGR01451 family)
VVRRALYLIPLVILVSSAVVADAGPLEGRIEAVRVIADTDGMERFVPADEANPSDIIEYRLTYSNDGQQPIRNVSVVDPVPFGTDYVGLTATVPDGGAVEFSLDNGTSFHAWPVKIKKTDENGEEVWVEASPDMVTHIRWSLASALEPETEITFTYRATVQ